MMNQLLENEHKVLCLPPKYTTFARINRVDVAEACQVMGHKMTWEIRSSGGGGPWPEEEAGCSGEDTIQ